MYDNLVRILKMICVQSIYLVEIFFECFLVTLKERRDDTLYTQ